MKAINRMNAVEVRNAVNNFNMGFATRREFAERMAEARAPYVSGLVNFALYVRDRWF